MKRKGSALLIVLGMMAFMIVSAVAFSAYMRTSRLPSSYLRRSNASRQLAKAAVAEAIDAVDRAIANNPHPGVGTETVETDGRTRNMWPGRVLLATNRVDEVGKTVPVLTMEALAYIPPPLVNEVRHYSRLTPNAAWHSFGFDAGRYAFCAVDVSDYLDVNRLAADRPRSSAPSSRISLSYLFETGREHTSSGSGASQWDAFMEQFRTPDEATLAFKYDSKVPLVSIADLNLALGEGGRGGLVSPFCSYVNTSGGDGFYNASSDDQLDKFRRMTFVTDSWFGGSNGASNDEESDYDEIYDLTDPQYQPFPSSLLEKSRVKLQTIWEYSSSGVKRMREKKIPFVSLFSLFDYLDTDSIPVSLACPTFERTPMICGLKPNIKGKFSLELNKELAGKVTDEQGNDLPAAFTEKNRKAYATYEYKIGNATFAAAVKGMNLEMLLVYPFPHSDAMKNQKFSIDGRAVFFLMKDSDRVTLRSSGKDAEVLHANDKNFEKNKGLTPENGTIIIPFNERDISSKLKQKPQEEVDAVFSDTIKTMDSVNVSEVIARIRYEWNQEWDSEAGCYNNQTKPDSAVICEAQCYMPPLTSEGVPDPDFVDPKSFLAKLKDDVNLLLSVAITARVKDEKGDCVDLVPANFSDDQYFIDSNNSVANQILQIKKNHPVMLFQTNVGVNFSKLEELGDVDFTEMTAVMIDDPRYNYAPESWYKVDGGFSPETWLNNNISREHDGDIFLATSDQGYMQSIYELAFLPRFSDIGSGSGSPTKGFLQDPADGRTTFDIQAKAGNRDLMWSSYRPFATKPGEITDDFESMGFTSSGSGFKVNPYSDSTNVIMAAFANTPIDWRMASTNNQEESLEDMSSSKFNSQYAWNAYSSESKFKWKDLEAVAGNFMDGILRRDQRNVENAPKPNDWRDAWDDLGWYDPANPDMFCGVNISDGTADLWGVDRKFLYGYWRDCFAAKQQLFLVFVRAEPFMMGGQGVSQSPPQLGARAVALVWRDPSKTSSTDQSTGKTGYPHRTRVLFYRQFE